MTAPGLPPPPPQFGKSWGRIVTPAPPLGRNPSMNSTRCNRAMDAPATNAGACVETKGVRDDIFP